MQKDIDDGKIVLEAPPFYFFGESLPRVFFKHGRRRFSWKGDFVKDCLMFRLLMLLFQPGFFYVSVVFG